LVVEMFSNFREGGEKINDANLREMNWQLLE
jgi:hypothetical protein